MNTLGVATGMVETVPNIQQHTGFKMGEYKTHILTPRPLNGEDKVFYSKCLDKSAPKRTWQDFNRENMIKTDDLIPMSLKKKVKK